MQRSKKKMFVICYKEQYDIIYNNYNQIFKKDLNEYEIILPYKFHKEKNLNYAIEKAENINFKKSLQEINIKKNKSDEAINTINDIIKYNAHKETLKEWAFQKEHFSREQIKSADKCVIIYCDDEKFNEINYKNYTSLLEYKREIEYAKKLNKTLRASTLKCNVKQKILSNCA